MPRVHIPRSSLHRRDSVYARLLCRVFPERRLANAFEGKLLKPGACIDEADLWPTDEYPETPLLLEYAGTDHSGSGHNRSNDIYVLWRYDRAGSNGGAGDASGNAGAWVELVRATSRGADWIEHLKPIAIAELGRGLLPSTMEQTAAQCADVSVRVLGVLDRELEMLGPGDRHLVMSYVYQEFSARALSYC